MTEPLISIIVPCYNTGEFIEKCINSLLGQTYENIEVLAVEHNSVDNTLESLLKMASSDDRLRVIKSYTMTTTGTTRNLGLAASKGDYLCFCDSDDFMEPDMVESLYKELIKTNSDIVYCDAFVNDYENPDISFNRSMHSDYDNMTYDKIMYDLMHSTEVMNKIIKRELVFDNGILFNDVTAGEDLYFTQLIYAKAKKITYLHKPLYHYLANRPSSTVTDPGADFDKQVIQTLKSVIGFHKKNNSPNKEITEIALYNYAMEHYIRFFHLKKSAAGSASEYMDFVREHFKNIENNKFYNLDVKPMFYKKKALMYDEMAKENSVFKNGNIVIFSASKGGVTMLSHLKGLSITPKYFSDNDIKKHGSNIEGIDVVKPECIAGVENALVIIAADVKYYDDIKKQVLSYGVLEDRIYP